MEIEDGSYIPAVIQMPTKLYREELETAWLRGWIHLLMHVEKTEAVEPSAYAKEAAADYAERVVGGSTRPGKPEASRPLGEQSSPQRPERPEVER